MAVHHAASCGATRSAPHSAIVQRTDAPSSCSAHETSQRRRRVDTDRSSRRRATAATQAAGKTDASPSSAVESIGRDSAYESGSTREGSSGPSRSALTSDIEKARGGPGRGVPEEG
eukprot:scaffold322535_cov39-Tisochrysis_lutea.AAC.4